MLSIKGKAEIRVVDSISGNIIREIRQTNIIPNATLVSLFNSWSAREIFTGLKISISTSTTTPEITNSQVTNIIGTGYVPSGLTSPAIQIDTPPFWGKIQNRIDFTGVSRTFNTLALTNLGSASVQPNVTATASAYLRLDTPCTQGATDFLDISYYIFVENLLGQGQIPSSRYLKDLTRALFGIDTGVYAGGAIRVTQFNHSLLFGFFGDVPSASYENLGSAYSLAGQFSFQPEAGWSSGAFIPSHYKWRSQINASTEERVGIILNSMMQGFNSSLNSAFTVKKFLDQQTSPLQNGFLKSAAATKPFFDSLEIATGSGKAVIQVDSWTKKYPHLYQIKIVNGGAVGVATYKIRKRAHLGFNGNQYSDLTIRNPFRNNLLPPAPTIHGWRDGDEFERWNETTICQYDANGVTLLDLFNGDFKAWDATTTPALNAIAIKQCAVDTVNKLIYVACRNTGIWVIDVPNNSLTNPVTFPCYGIAVGRNNVAFALIEGALINSDDWGALLPFNYPDVTSSNWSKVRYIKIDSSSLTDDMAIVMQTTGASHRIVWWRNNNANGISGVEDAELVKNYPSSIGVSSSGFWATSSFNPLNFAQRVYRLNVGTAGGIQIASDIRPPDIQTNNPNYGNQYYRKIAFVGNNLILGDRLIDSSGAILTTYAPISGVTMEMAGGIVIAGSNMRQLFTDNNFCWQEYGWDGSNWVLGNPNPRMSSLSLENIIDGLQVRFENGTTPPHFVAGEYLNQFVNWGLLKDNATTLQYESGWYSKPVKFNQAVPPGLVVPSVAPYTITLPIAGDADFITIEVDTPRHNRFTLNGAAIANLYVDGVTPPGPNEIRITGITGTLEFNSADAGKTLGGFYAYISHA